MKRGLRNGRRPANSDTPRGYKAYRIGGMGRAAAPPISAYVVAAFRDRVPIRFIILGFGRGKRRPFFFSLALTRNIVFVTDTIVTQSVRVGRNPPKFGQITAADGLKGRRSATQSDAKYGRPLKGQR